LKIIFDLDGTLVDSATIIASILNELRKTRGYHHLNHSEYKKIISLGAEQLIKETLHTNSSETVHYLELFRSIYKSTKTPLSSVYDGAFDVLDHLMKNKHRIGICSNKPEFLCRKILFETGLIQYFTAIVGGDTTSNAKPHPEPALVVSAALGREDEPIYFIGDSSVDQRTAQSIGASFIFFSGGYNDGVDESLNTYTIDSLAQIKSLSYENGELIF
jgi:phosphoglycolate phosphatase